MRPFAQREIGREVRHASVLLLTVPGRSCNLPSTAGACPMPRPAPRRRADYRFFSAVATRWADNDIYGHVNNVVYYGLFDTAVDHYMLREAGLDPWKDGVFDVVVETGCRYY